MPTNYKIDGSGIAALETREGVRLKAYLDSVGRPTIGTGHTGLMSLPLVHMGMTITRLEADEYLANDLEPLEKAINDLNLKLTQNQYNALVSVGFNIGIHGLVGSSTVKQIKLGNYQEAADDLLMWEKPPELKERREGERAQFLTADKPVAQAAATSASKPAAKSKTKETTMATAASASLVTAAQKEAVNVGAGISNFFENLGHQLTNVKAASAAGVTTTSDGKPLPSVTTQGHNIISDIEGAIDGLKTTVSDFNSGAIGSGIEDVVSLITTGMAILTKFNITVPGLSEFTVALKTVEAFL